MSGSTTAVDSNTLVRALAITLVVANHSWVSQELHGGMNLLLLLSGLNLATFTLLKPEREVYLGGLRLLRGLLLPSFALAMAFAVMYRDFRYPELLFFSNWITVERVSHFPVWYPQMLLQLLLALAAIFWLAGLHRKILARPMLATGLILAAALALNVGARLVWDTSPLRDQLPHLLAWNFVAGWAIWAARLQLGDGLRARLFSSALLAVCAALAFGVGEPDHALSRAVAWGALGACLVWVTAVRLPRPLAHVIGMVSQATLHLFLLHRVFIVIAYNVLRAVGIDPEQSHAPVFAIAMLGPLAVWLVGTAFIRAARLRSSGVANTLITRSPATIG